MNHKWTPAEERHIIAQDAQGATTDAIAAELGLTNKQVYQHRFAMSRGRRSRRGEHVTQFQQWLNKNMMWRATSG